MTTSTRALTRSGPRLVTLCFHGIGSPSRALEPGEERFWITPDNFVGILDAVRRHPRQVDVTFDDANESDFLYALPALRDAGLSAQFFPITDRLGRAGSLSIDQVTELQAAGMSIGTHGMSHRSWRDLADLHILDLELAGSVRLLSGITDSMITSAALPRGQYDRRVLAAVKRHGFSRVYSVDEGSSRSSAWLRSRYTVIAADTVESVTEFLDNPDRSLRERLFRSAKVSLKGWR